VRARVCYVNCTEGLLWELYECVCDWNVLFHGLKSKLSWEEQHQMQHDETDECNGWNFSFIRFLTFAFNTVNFPLCLVAVYRTSLAPTEPQGQCIAPGSDKTRLEIAAANGRYKLAKRVRMTGHECTYAPLPELHGRKTAQLRRCLWTAACFATNGAP